MSVRLLSVPEEHYHIYNRGVDKRLVFSDNYDYKRFLLLLLLSNDINPVDVKTSIKDYSISELIAVKRKPIVNIFAFALLPNHFHLLVSAVEQNGVSKFMQKVATGYTMYFNKKNERTGALFQGKYKIKHASEDRYLKYLFEYIHLNSIREKFDVISQNKIDALVSEAELEPTNSLSVYSRKGNNDLSGSIVNKQLFEDLFSSYPAHRKSLCSWSVDGTFDNKTAEK